MREFKNASDARGLVQLSKALIHSTTNIVHEFCRFGKDAPPQAKQVKLDRSGFKLHVRVEFQDTLQRLERAALQQCIRKQDEVEAGQADNVLQDLHAQLKLLTTEINERVDARIERVETYIERLESKIDSGFERLAQSSRGGADSASPPRPRPHPPAGSFETARQVLGAAVYVREAPKLPQAI